MKPLAPHAVCAVCGVGCFNKDWRQMQLQTYPLPPLYLTPIIDQCLADHTHVCGDACADEPDYCQSRHAENRCLVQPFVVQIEEGYGRHRHDQECAGDALRRGYECIRYCDDSDWIVTLQYSSKGYLAVYGITRHGDVQDIALWMD